MYNKLNELVSGSEEPDTEVFHVIRFERAFYPRKFIAKAYIWLGSSGYYKWLEHAVSDYLEQWTIIDVDGFMKGNTHPKLDY
jgi:hypothetical protein